MNSTPITPGNATVPAKSGKRPAALVLGTVMAIGLMVPFTGCQEAPTAPPAQAAAKPDSETITEGDVLKIEFPGAPNLNLTQQVRRDGRITLAIIGEVFVSGTTPVALEKDLADRYASQLLSKEVSVTIVSSSFSVFVTGAVGRPGKLQPDHPITVLEAIMEAGGFDNDKSDTSHVVVIRKEGTGTKNFTLNLQEVLDGKSGQSFYLKPDDIVYIKEKFNWF